MPSTPDPGRGRAAATVAVAAVAPLSLVLYAQLATPNPPTAWWAVDGLAFLALFLGLVLVGSGRSLVRGLWLGAVTVAAVLAHLGTVLYERFFHDWPTPGVLAQWRDLGAAQSSVVELVRPSDVVLGVAVPVAAAAVLAARSFAVPRAAPPLLLGAAVLLGLLHHTYVGPPPSRRLSAPAPYLLRGPLYERLEQGRRQADRREVLAALDRFYPRERGYRRAMSADGILGLTPEAGESGPERPLNVVIVLLESVTAAASGAYGASPSFTPVLDALAARSLVATDFYANGGQTMRAEFATLCSFYPSPMAPVYRAYRDQHFKVRCLPDILRSHGYRTIWMSSFEKGYSNKYEFLSRHGVDEFHDIEEFPPDAPTYGWGPTDEVLFARVLDRLDRTPEPFFIEVTTLSNHHPFDYDYTTNPAVPPVESSIYGDWMRGIYYTDYALGRFFARARGRAWFERTVFVVLGDHGIWLFPQRLALTPVERQERYFRVPLVIHAPGVVAPRRVTDVASQIDVAPTLLDLLGIRAEHAFVGRSLLREPDADEPERFVLMTHNRQWNLRRGDRYCYEAGEECFYEHEPYCPAGYERDARRTRSCFRYPDDLMVRADGSPGAPALAVADDPELENLGQRLVDFNLFLIGHNRLARGESPATAP